jgi:hypothetical protein
MKPVRIALGLAAGALIVGAALPIAAQGVDVGAGAKVDETVTGKATDQVDAKGKAGVEAKGKAEVDAKGKAGDAKGKAAEKLDEVAEKIADKKEEMDEKREGVGDKLAELRAEHEKSLERHKELAEKKANGKLSEAEETELEELAKAETEREGRRKALEERRAKQKDTWKERRREARRKVLAAHPNIEASAELRAALKVHAKRMARLQRAKAVAEAEGRDELAERVAQLTEREVTRHERKLAGIDKKDGGTTAAKTKGEGNVDVGAETEVAK